MVLGKFISAGQVPDVSAEQSVSLTVARLEVRSRYAHRHKPCETHCHTLRAQRNSGSTWTVPQQFQLTCLGGHISVGTYLLSALEKVKKSCVRTHYVERE